MYSGQKNFYNNETNDCEAYVTCNKDLSLNIDTNECFNSSESASINSTLSGNETEEEI